MVLNIYPALIFTLLTTYLSFAQSLQEGNLILKDNSILPIKIFKNYKPQNEIHVHKSDFLKVIVNDTVKEIHPKDVKGFTIGKKIYESLQVKTTRFTIHLFCEVLEMGNVSLYNYSGNAFGQKEIFIFNRKGDAQYYISLDEKLKGGTENTNISGNSMPADLNLNNEINKMVNNVSDANAFKAQFIRYFSDCPEIINKLKQDWYTPTSITSLFQDYNSSCHKR